MASGALAPSRARPSTRERLPHIPKAVREALVERVRSGVPLNAAAESVGISRRSIHRWLERGRQDDAPASYAALARDVDQAFAEWEVESIQEIGAAGGKDWRARAFLVENLVPEFVANKRAKAGDLNLNVQVVEAERSDLSARLLGAAQRVLGDDPELLARFMAEVAGGEVVVGEAAEVAELAP